MVNFKLFFFSLIYYFFLLCFHFYFFGILGLYHWLHLICSFWNLSSYVGILTLKPDAKNDDKANAMRSKHSVTEQRRRSKINERYVWLSFLFSTFPDFISVLPQILNNVCRVKFVDNHESRNNYSTVFEG
jgi:hypothetical protein